MYVVSCARIALVSIIFFAGICHAKNILNQTERPTAVEVSKLPASVKKEIASYSSRNDNVNAWMNNIPKYGPNIVGTFLEFFPNATYVFMGRDTRAMADIFGSFLTSAGDPNRVMVIAGSKPTYADANGHPIHTTNHALLYKFVSKQGLSVEAIESSPYPFVLIDTLSGGGGRQGRIVMHCLLTEYANRNKSQKKLLDKVRFVGLQTSTYNVQVPKISAAKISKADNHNKTLIDNGVTDYFNNYQMVVYPDKSGAAFNEIGYEHYTYAWHGSYLNIEPSGKSPPGSPSDQATRYIILSYQLKIVEMTKKNSFARDVDKHISRSSGFSPRSGRKAEPSVKTSRNSSSDPIDVFSDPKLLKVRKNIWNEFQDFLDSAEETDQVQLGLTEGGEELKAVYSDLLRAFPAHHVIVNAYMLRAVTIAHKANQVRKRDLKFLFEETVRNGKISPQYTEELIALSKESSSFYQRRIMQTDWLPTQQKIKNLTRIQAAIRNHNNVYCSDAFTGVF